MSDSILTSVKQFLGITEEYTHFDSDVIMGINTSFSILTQLGVGPRSGFAITDSSSVWGDYPVTGPLLELVESYVARKTKLLFDPPTSSSTLEALQAVVSELEWRMNSFADFPEDTEGG